MLDVTGGAVRVVIGPSSRGAGEGGERLLSQRIAQTPVGSKTGEHNVALA